MTEQPIVLLPTDPTIFTKCEACAKVLKGVSQPQYFAKAYSYIQWKQHPTCDNCDGELTVLYRVRQPKRRRSA